MRPILALLLIAVPATGCQTGYGKVFGPATVLSAVVGTTLIATANPELGGPVADPDTKLGIGLVFASCATAAIWMLGEIYAGQPHGGGGGGGLFVPPAAVDATPIAAPVEAPVVAAPPIEAPPAEPPPAPVVVVTPAPPSDPSTPPGAADNEVYDRAGRYLGRYDTSNGGVWDVHGAWYGNIDLSCSVACRRSQARTLLKPPRTR